MLVSTSPNNDTSDYWASQLHKTVPVDICYFFVIFWQLYIIFTRVLEHQKVSCGNRSINLRTTSPGKVRDWISAISDAALKPPEGWCHPHRYGSFAPPRGLNEDGSQVQWFIDGEAAFEAVASAIEDAKFEVVHFIYTHNRLEFSSSYAERMSYLFADIHYWVVALP